MPTQWDEFEVVDEQPSIDWSEFEPVSAQGETREQLTAQMEQAREERKQSEMADKIGEFAERTLEPLTFPGLLNQPARIAGQPDPFHAGESIAPIPMPTGTGVISGLGQLGAGVVNSLTTPEGLATLPLAAVSAPIRALFAAEMASALPEQISAGGEALRSPETTPAQKVVAAGQPLVTAAFVRGLAQTPKLVKDIADLRKAEVKPEFKPEEFEVAEPSIPSEQVTQKQPWEMTAAEFAGESIGAGPNNPIVSAAALGKSGQVYRSPLHAQAYEKAKSAGDEPIGGYDREQNVGYVTRNGRFIPSVIAENRHVGLSGEALRKGEAKEKAPSSFDPDHLRSIRQAFAEGKTIPPEVLKDYPASIIAPEKTDVPIEVPGVEAVRAGPGAAAPADVAAESAAQAAGVRTAEYINKSLEQKDIPTQPDIPVAESELKMSDPQVEQRWNAAKLTTPSWTEKAKGIADAAYRSATRHFRHLDPKEDGVLIDTLRVHENDPLFAKFQASQVLRGITDGLKPKKYDVFSRIAILRDLAKYGERFGQELEDLPFGYKSWDAVKQDLGRFEALAEKYPDIKESLNRRDAFMDALRYDLVARDLLPETVKDFGEYFHHQVLEYMRLKEPYASTGSKDVRTHKKGWQKKRVGSAKDYNTDYLESEFEVISQSFAQMATQDVLKQLKRTADISDQLKIAAKEAKAEGQDVSWQQLIPDGYTLWQPEKGNHFYWANSITDKALDAYFMKQKDISPADIKEVMAMGGKREQWVIPERLAKTLDEFTPPKDHPIEKAVGIGLSNWKRWTLFNPMRNVIYELNNFSGDADIAFAVDPKIFKHAPQSAKEVAKFVRAKEGATKEMSDLVRLGVIDSGFSVQELPDLKGNQFFRALQGKDPTLTQRYWENVLDFNRWREGVLRLASYRRALELLNEGKRPLWTSKRAEMEALYRDPNVTREQVAAKLAREAIGDYGNISHAGQWIRAKLIPFYSWMEINSPRYVRLIKNVSAEEGATGAAGRVAAVAGKKVASQAAKLSLRMGAFYILANLWNKTFFPEEDRELNTTKDQFHVILKRNDDGTITSIRLQGALSDALSWFGAEDLVKDIQDVREQRASVQDKAIEMAKAPVNKLVQASWPLYKSGFEAIVKRQTFPDVFNPRPIRDPKQHLARVVSMGSIYDYLASKPQRPGTWSLKALATYTTDPGEAAYMTSRSIVEDKLKELNEPRGQFDATERSNALYYLKQSIRYKNEKLQEYWTKRYIELGGNPKYISRSIEAMDPWKFAPTKVRGQVQSMLSPAEKEIMDRASEWYRKVYVEER